MSFRVIAPNVLTPLGSDFDNKSCFYGFTSSDKMTSAFTDGSFFITTVLMAWSFLLFFLHVLTAVIHVFYYLNFLNVQYWVTVPEFCDQLQTLGRLLVTLLLRTRRESTDTPRQPVDKKCTSYRFETGSSMPGVDLGMPRQDSSRKKTQASPKLPVPVTCTEFQDGIVKSVEEKVEEVKKQGLEAQRFLTLSEIHTSLKKIQEDMSSAYRMCQYRQHLPEPAKNLEVLLSRLTHKADRIIQQASANHATIGHIQELNQIIKQAHNALEYLTPLVEEANRKGEAERCQKEKQQAPAPHKTTATTTKTSQPVNTQGTDALELFTWLDGAGAENASSTGHQKRTKRKCNDIIMDQITEGGQLDFDWNIIKEDETYVFHCHNFNCDMSLDGRDIHTLKAPNGLNDKVIEVFLSLLDDRENPGGTCNVLVIPWYITELWQKGKYNSQYDKDDMAKFKWIFAPINLDRKHWMLLVANGINRKVDILDSCETLERKSEFLSHWREFMGQDWDSGSLRSTQQTDNHSCGAFVLLNAWALVRGINLSELTTEHALAMRVHAAIKILQEIAAFAATKPRSSASTRRNPTPSQSALVSNMSSRER